MTHDVPAPAQRVLDSASRVETPCGDGAMVWHVWGDGLTATGLRTLVLLHGGSGSWMHWVRNIPAYVLAGYRVIVPDMPGFGDSAHPGGDDADAVVAPMLAGLRELLGETGTCALIGFSWGGLAAGLLAQADPARFERVIVVSAPLLAFEQHERVRLVEWRHLATEAERERAHRSNLAALMFHEEAAIDELAMGLHAWNMDRDRMRRRLKPGSLAPNGALAGALARCGRPVRAIYAAEDVLFRDRFPAVRAALESVPTFEALQVIPQAGHWVQYEKAAAFDEALLALLA